MTYHRFIFQIPEEINATAYCRCKENSFQYAKPV